MKKKICFIAQFPPPIHGLSKAVDTLYNSALNNEKNSASEFEFEKINITDNKRFLTNLNLIRKSKANLFYFTISQTIEGNIRDLIILELLRIQHKKCVIHLHGGYYRQLVEQDMCNLQRKINYKLVSQLAGTIVLGESLRSIFQGMISDEKIFVIPNCIDDKYLMDEADFEKKINELNDYDIKHVLYLSNFIRDKGYLKVLEMAKIEKKVREEAGKKIERKFHFDFAGIFFEENEKKAFLNFIVENGLSTYVTYHGVVDGEKKRDLLKRCDIFVLLTQYRNEGQPVSILEAMGNGMVIVTTNHAGIPDIVKNGENGIVVNKEKIDVESIYRNMKDICFQSIMYNNRRLVLDHYKESHYIGLIRECWSSI